MSDIPKDPALRARYAEIQESRAKAREAARAADRTTHRRGTTPLEEAQADVERLEAKVEARAAARRLMTPKEGR